MSNEMEVAAEVPAVEAGRRWREEMQAGDLPQAKQGR